MIVPEVNTLVEDVVDTWKSDDRAPITFDVFAPMTPAGEGVSIQLNPGFSWTEPIPMWPMGNNHWKFMLTSPLNLVNEVGYRYCREDQCGRADDARTMGSDSPPLAKISSGPEAKAQNDTIDTWAWLVPEQPATVPSITVAPRGASFIAGIEFLPYYQPNWEPRWPKAIKAVSDLGANWLFLTPTWSFTRNLPPVLEPLPGQDPLWPTLVNMINQARNANLNVAVFPIPRFPTEAANWWQDSRRDFSWWVSWFDHYRTFILNHADLAARNGAQALILGGEWLQPALPGGILVDGTPSGVPGDAEARWRSLLGEVRARFSGMLIWALPFPEGVQSPPSFLDAVDGVYIMWSAPLAKTISASESEMESEAQKILDGTLMSFQQKLAKPLWLGISYPSADGGVTGCLPTPTGGCLSFDALARLREDIPGISLDLLEQTDAYIAMLSAVETRPWISGVVSRGFYPPLPLQDKSTSVYGKPAAGALWFWFPQWAK
jgi:hypothetical protein